MKSPTAKFRAGLVVELHPSPVLEEASALPFQSVVRGRSSAHERGKKVHCAVEGVEDRPRDLSRQKREDVPGAKW